MDVRWRRRSPLARQCLSRKHVDAMRIAYVQYTNPAGYPPLAHSSKILADGGADILFLGTSSFGSSSLRFQPHPRIRVRQLSVCRGRLLRKLHYVVWATWVVLHVAFFRPSWLYASDAISSPLALILSFLPGLTVVYHEHDAPAAPRSLIRLARRHLARRARMTVIPNDDRRRIFEMETGVAGRTITVWNCPSRLEVAPARRRRVGDDMWMWYHGSLGPELLPLTVVRALAQLPTTVKLRAVGYETSSTVGYADQLRQTAERLGVGNRLEVLPAVSRGELLQRCQTSDVGLALLATNTSNVNMCHLVGASNKPFDYMACGLALVVPDAQPWREAFVDNGYGLACDPESVPSLVAAITELLNNADERRAKGERGRQRVLGDWNYETQFARLLRSLESDDIAVNALDHLTHSRSAAQA
jgi:glycosyltransferase involved in cell wall biosynthesis